MVEGSDATRIFEQPADVGCPLTNQFTAVPSLTSPRVGDERIGRARHCAFQRAGFASGELSVTREWSPRSQGWPRTTAVIVGSLKAAHEPQR
jgi:hypothetical protein